MTKIDLNSDLGESFGRYNLGKDKEIIQLVTSVNIACGFHASDPDVMAKTVALAEEAGVGIGAHPGYPDLQGFGRRNMLLQPAEVEHLITYQVGALQAFTSSKKLHHVKPHGALYNMAAKDYEISLAICHAIKSIDPDLPIYALAGSKTVQAAETIGIRCVQEVFGDRNYLPDGNLVPRSEAHAVITDPAEVAAHVLEIVKNQAVTAIDGSTVPLQADSICVHGDNAAALAIVANLRETLQQNKIKLQAF
ncbi:MAG: 5-oxoprolinase subunit PxpA [Liquorilactobacillus hordei]|uniref:LamB/YcsF family protein n=1 Tax=Liquorilactobacillus hordei TaxID=468911 RepID=UPI0039EC097D